MINFPFWLYSPLQHSGTAHDGTGKNTRPSLAHSPAQDMDLNPRGKEAADPGLPGLVLTNRGLLHTKAALHFTIFFFH